MTHDESPKIAIGENLKIEVPIRRVIKTDKGYAIAEFKNIAADLWILVSKYYAHSTSAFAVLGKLYQKDMIDAVPERYRMGETALPAEPKEHWSGDHKVKTTEIKRPKKN